MSMTKEILSFSLIIIKSRQ